MPLVGSGSGLFLFLCALDRSGGEGEVEAES
jgi:hypothetical protein